MKAGSHSMPEVCGEASATHSARPDRSVTLPSAAAAQAGVALGGHHRGDDAALASKWQKRRWWAGFALGCVLICTVGGADADQGLRFASDGSVCGRERGGAGVHWTSPRGQGSDSRPLQHRPGLCGSGQSGDRRGQPLGAPGGASLWLCRRGEFVGRHHGAGTPHWLSQRTGHLAGAGPTLWPRLDAVEKARRSGTRQRPGSGADDLALGQRTSPVYHGQSGQTPGVDPDH